MINKNLINKLKNFVKKIDGLDLFILFGSRAKGNYNENSDWDFAILINDKFKENDLITLREELYKLLDTEKIDLINLDIEDNPVLRYEIFKDGICIYEKKKGLFDINQTNTWFNYLYFKPEIEQRNKLIEKSLKEMV